MIDNNLMDDNYISIDDAAAYLGIKTVTLAQLDKEKTRHSGTSCGETLEV